MSAFVTSASVLGLAAAFGSLPCLSPVALDIGTGGSVVQVSWWPFLVGAILVLLALGLLIFFLIRRRKDKDDDDAAASAAGTSTASAAAGAETPIDPTPESEDFSDDAGAQAPSASDEPDDNVE